MVDAEMLQSRHRHSMLSLLAGSAFLFTGGAWAEVLLEWNIKKEAVEESTLRASTGPDGKLTQPAQFDSDGHLVFDGKQSIALPEEIARKLTHPFSVEARVRIDNAQDWGGIISFSQDNGSYERGWLLGYNGRRFCFKVSDGTRFPSGDDRNFALGEWIHVAATYDGEKADLFVNGQLQVSAPLGNKLTLPEEPTPFVLGAYHDKDEHFPLVGRLDFIRVYRGQLPAHILPEAKKAAIPDHGPSRLTRVSFPTPTSALIAWEDEAQAATLYYGSGKKLTDKVEAKATEGRFEVTLENLKPSTIYRYRIAVREEGKLALTPFYSFDTRHNLSQEKTAPKVPDQHKRIVDTALATAPDQNGYALVLGLSDGDLTAALASSSRLHIVAADHDPQRLTAVRKKLYRAKLLGHRVSVVQLPAEGPAPWNDRFADLIVTEQEIPALPAEECRRLLRPQGALLVSDSPALKEWQGSLAGPATEGLFTLRGDHLPGAQNWSHQYGTAGNAAYTGEALGDVSTTSGLGVQWIGLPGGDFGIDRQPRMPAPLSVNGRLFHQGMNRMVALNAYNGAVLWAYEVPALRRLNVAHDSSNWCADDQRVYVAVGDQLWILDAKSGQYLQSLELPKNTEGKFEWAYVAQDDEHLIGSAVFTSSAFQDFWGKEHWFDKVGTAGATTQICSEQIHGFSKSTGESRWAYGRGLIINSTLALHDGKLYFLENRTFKQADRTSSRVSDRRLWLDLTTVCLDASTGDLLWEKPGLKTTYLTEKIGFVQAAYGIATDTGFLAMLSEGTVNPEGAYQKKGEFLCTLYEHDGEVKWQMGSPWKEDHHGIHITHPVVTEDKVYLAPQVHDLATGEYLNQSFGPRRGCSTIIATRRALLFRILGGTSPLGFWNRDTGSVSRFMRLRPSCWLNVLPTQGMLLIPEGGAGCSCGGWMETSVGFLPLAHPPIEIEK